MKIAKYLLAALVILMIAACASGPRVTVQILEEKGTINGIAQPDWVRTYVQYGVTRLQAQSEFRDMYCIVGEETGTNRQFVLAWADNFSAQQRIGAMLRTTIASEYNARVQGASQSAGITGAAGMESTYSQEIESVINTIVNVSYSGALRVGDWWILSRRYDLDDPEIYTDSYTAYVLYTIPKAELNRQVARVLETSVSMDSALYEVTIELARQLLLDGAVDLGAE